MKKLTALASAMILLTGCGADIGTQPAESYKENSSPAKVSETEPQAICTLSGTVCETDENSLLILSDEIGRATVSGTEIPEDIAPGDRVTVEYTGEILESYPAYVHGAVKIDLDQKAERPMQYITGSSELLSYSFLAPADWTLTAPGIYPENGGSRLEAPDGSGAVEMVIGPLGVCGTGLTIIDQESGGIKTELYSYSEGTWDFAAFPEHEGIYLANSADPANYDDIYAMLETLEIM